MYTNEQVLMTLAALAPTCSTALPGETVAAQAGRIGAGIATQLAMPDLATANEWDLVWLGLTEDRANLSYVARNVSANAYAVVLRGTIEVLVDAAEDLKVWSTVPFPQGGSAQAYVSEGALEAFGEIVGATGEVGDPSVVGLTLLPALKVLLTTAAPSPTVYVTGHSLGGALATTVGLYVEAAGLRNDLTCEVWTFAAPTAGVVSFQKWFDGVFGDRAHRTYNAYDLVPLAWQDLTAAEKWYPPPGPTASTLDVAMLATASKLTDGNPYAQPTANPDVLNTEFTVHAAASASYLDEVAFQHHSSTYLTLLQAPATPAWPDVHGISPHSGPRSGGTTVTVVGSGFRTGALVYFSAVPGTNVQVLSDSMLTVDAPPEGFGRAEVSVTTFAGTSATSSRTDYWYL